MKRVFLLLTTCFFTVAAMAQDNNAGVTVPLQTVETPGGLHKVVNPPVVKMNNHHENSTMRTTSGVTFSDWFDYWNQNATSTPTLYSYFTYPDSNVVDNTGSVSYNIYTHGLGMSFDPTDVHYFDSAVTSPITDPYITDSTSYTIDSFRFPYEYVHEYSTSGVDSVIVELFVTTMSTTIDSGDYTLIFSSSSTFSGITPDLTPRFATVKYTPTASHLGQNECWDSITAQKQRYAFPLVVSGSTGIIYSTMNVRLSTPLVCGPGEKVISFVHFKSAYNFSLGTDVGSANYMILFAGTTASSSTTWPEQPAHNTATGYPGSYQTGLIAENQNRYTNYAPYTYNDHNIIIPGVAFSIPQLAVTQQAFHVNWTSFPNITGTMSVCVGSTTTLSDAATGGTWSSGATSIATVNSSGVVYGVSPGTAVISYSIGSASQTATVTVLGTPTTPTFTGGTTVCTGQNFTLIPSATGGTWSSTSTTIATVNTTGGVYGVSAGTAVISYAISNICGSASGGVAITVNASPVVAAIAGHDTVCPARTITLTDATTGGTWMSSVTTVASISGTGVVTGLSNGTDVIWYIVNNSTCSDTAKLTFYVHCTEGINNVNGQGAEKISVYPNPNEGAFTMSLSSPVDEEAVVRITNITGQVVKEINVTTNKMTTIQLNEPSGIYFISTTLSGGKYVEKITIIK